ncbi:MAG: glutamine amidotransferase [Arthrobacter sp.]|uniref:glutamine amidotransferase n=1 Tax=Arthrobacter sp. TaxID=1667 RepID=UPI00349614C7
MTTKPFLLISTREDDDAAADEVRGFLELSGLEPGRLAVVRLGLEPLPDAVAGDAPGLADYAGIMVGGSPFNSSDPDGLKSATQRRVEATLSRLLDSVAERDFPFLGACYGVGTLGTHQGAVVDRTYGEPVGTTEVELTAAGLEDPLTEGLPRRFTAFVGHKEAVAALPGHAVLLAGSAACPVQMFRFGSNLYATQFHPELDGAGLALRIAIYKDAGYFPPEEAEELTRLAHTAEVPWPGLVLRNFVARYGG